MIQNRVQYLNTELQHSFRQIYLLNKLHTHIEHAQSGHQVHKNVLHKVLNKRRKRPSTTSSWSRKRCRCRSKR